MSSPTNMLFLMTDQHRTDTLGCYGNPHVWTPHLDALAASGTRFNACFTPSAICTPARASLLTGVMPFRHRLLANYERNVGYAEELSDEFTPFSRRLREVGYNVGIEGKWHVGKNRGPGDFGFDGAHYPGWHNPIGHPDYRAWLARQGFPSPTISDEVRGVFPNGEPGNLLAGVVHQPAEATFEHFLTDRTIERLEQYARDHHRDGRPFFMATHFYGPHLPYLLPREYLEMYSPEDVELPPSLAETFENKPLVQRRYSEHWTYDTLGEDTWRWLIAAYWGYTTLIDQQVGRLLDALRRLDLWDSTAVAFTADHGEFTGSHRLHDKGPAMYDDIYRIPGLLRVPGSPGGHSTGAFVSLVDYTATILDLAGIDPDPDADGRSLVPLATGDEPADWRDDITAEFHGHHFPYPQRMLRTRRYKLVVNPESVNELYDLQDDPHELTNRYDDPQLNEIRVDLLHRLYERLRASGDNFHHWMTSMYQVGGKDYDTSLSDFEGVHHQA
ncbi:sulfatase-like hydrolase/transferase [Phytoactinopolyspora halotolerans]|uniref:Sulfatase-like hydrolase/transferase n=1 Tax=Phytoactinopolyspora halotolerans TaxID=1981512 RepID=A0A6L9SHN1_9ACTN|nr:sulfatase-like hydrolase/transferase [Phytoactinopolyspora halotolerans]NEE03821.1 sulfatase-like hydrolase/transferase [Phytoactinopolyspora halotolerans]